MDFSIQQANLLYMNYNPVSEHFRDINYHADNMDNLKSSLSYLKQQLDIPENELQIRLPDELYRISRLQSFHYYAIRLLSYVKRGLIHDPELIRHMCTIALSSLREERTVRLINMNILEQFRVLYQSIMDSF
jgi:hypothetical protein